MLSENNARKALQYNFNGNNIKVGNPVPFTHGYDNYSGGMGAISNFNSLMQSPTNYPITGKFGHPLPGQAQNLKSTFPHYDSTWVASDFSITGGGLTRTWIGTAVTFNDVTIVIDVATLMFTGTLGAYGTISGQAVVNMGIGSILNGTLVINSFKNIFYGKIGWGMTNDGLGTVNHQILVNSYFDTIGLDYAITLNAGKTLEIAPVTFDSLQGEITGTASSIYMAGKNNIYFDGYIFPIAQN